MRASDSSSLPHRHGAWALLAPCSHPNHASNKFPACRRDSHSPPVGTPCSRARQQSPLLLPIDTTRQSSYVTTSDKEPRVDTTPGKLFVFIYLLLFFWEVFYQTIQHQAPLPHTCRDDDRNSWSQRDDAFDRGASGRTRRAEHGDERIPFSSTSSQLASRRYRKSLVRTGLPLSSVHAEKLL